MDRPRQLASLLNAIDRDSLQGDKNLAYHALLLTQAQFHVDYTLFNSALAYYSDNHNRDHYT